MKVMVPKRLLLSSSPLPSLPLPSERPLTATLHDWAKFAGGLDCRLGPSPHDCARFGGRNLRVAIALPIGSIHGLAAWLAGGLAAISELLFESRALGPELGP